MTNRPTASKLSHRVTTPVLVASVVVQLGVCGLVIESFVISPMLEADFEILHVVPGGLFVVAAVFTLGFAGGRLSGALPDAESDSAIAATRSAATYVLLAQLWIGLGLVELHSWLHGAGIVSAVLGGAAVAISPLFFWYAIRCWRTAQELQ